MAKYKVQTRLYVKGAIYNPGDTVELKAADAKAYGDALKATAKPKAEAETKEAEAPKNKKMEKAETK